MPRQKRNEQRPFDAETFGKFIKTVSEAQGKFVADVAHGADLNRQAIHNLELSSNVPSIRTIEAVCHQIGLDPLMALESSSGDASRRASGRRHVVEGRLAELSEDDLPLALDFIDLLRTRAKPAANVKRKTGRT